MDQVLVGKLAIATVAIIGGGFLVAALLWIVRTSILGKYKFSDCFAPMDLWIGSIERLVAIVLAIWATPSLPVFIGGWVALKFAANWKRREPKKPGNTPELDQIAKESLISLIGNVFSFSIAIGAAIYLAGPINFLGK